MTVTFLIAFFARDRERHPILAGDAHFHCEATHSHQPIRDQSPIAIRVEWDRDWLLCIASYREANKALNSNRFDSWTRLDRMNCSQSLANKQPHYHNSHDN